MSALGQSAHASTRARAQALMRARRAMGITPIRRKQPRLPRAQHPTHIALDYWHAIQPIVYRTHELIQRDLIPYLPHILAEQARAMGRMDAPVDVNRRFEKLGKDVAAMIRPDDLARIAQQFGQQVSAFQKRQLAAQAKAALRVDLTVIEPDLAGGLGAFVSENVGLIRSLPQKYLDDVEDRVLGALRSGERWETLAGDIEERYGIATRRAQLIARDQVGKFFGELNQSRQEAMGVTGYTWRTMNDERVRDEHEERDGQPFTWEDPPEDGAPGEAVNCRCYAEPDFSGLLSAED